MSDTVRRPRSTPLPYVLVLPAVLALALALGYPLVRQVVLSFQDFGLAQQFGRPPEWIGLQNYRDLVGDGYLWRVTIRTVLFCLVNAAATMLVSFTAEKNSAMSAPSAMPPHIESRMTRARKGVP